jgi:hypothetical protein
MNALLEFCKAARDMRAVAVFLCEKGQWAENQPMAICRAQARDHLHTTISQVGRSHRTNNARALRSDLVTYVNYLMYGVCTYKTRSAKRENTSMN